MGIMAQQGTRRSNKWTGDWVLGGGFPVNVEDTEVLEEEEEMWEVDELVEDTGRGWEPDAESEANSMPFEDFKGFVKLRRCGDPGYISIGEDGTNKGFIGEENGRRV